MSTGLEENIYKEYYHRGGGAFISTYCQISNIRHTLVENRIIDLSDVVRASPSGAAPTTSSLWI